MELIAACAAFGGVLVLAAVALGVGAIRRWLFGYWSMSNGGSPDLQFPTNRAAVNYRDEYGGGAIVFVPGRLRKKTHGVQ